MTFCLEARRVKLSDGVGASLRRESVLLLPLHLFTYRMFGAGVEFLV